jgi:hypothetical protein
VGDEREVFVGLPQQLGVALLRVLRDGTGGSGDYGVEQNLVLPEGELCPGLSGGGDDGVAKCAILAHHRVQTEAQPKALRTVPCRGCTMLRQRSA